MTEARRIAAVVLFLLSGAFAGFAQQAGGAGTAPPAPPAPKPAPEWKPPPPFEDTRHLERAPQPQFGFTPTGITGIVKRADGQALRSDAIVEVLCQGKVLAATHTRNRFQLVLQQADVGAGRPTADGAARLAGCLLHVRVSGFLPASVTLSTISTGTIDIGSVTLRPFAEGARFADTATTLLAPKDARAAWDKGRRLMERAKFEDAVESLVKATSLYPRFAAAWCDLGSVYQQLGQAEDARKAYAASIEADRQYMPPYMQLAVLAASLRAWPMVESLTAEIARRNPYDFPQAYLYHAAASYNLGQMEAAERSARRTIELDPQGNFPRAYLLLGRILTETQRNAEAEEPLARYRELTEGTPEAEEARTLLDPKSPKPGPFRMSGGDQ